MEVGVCVLRCGSLGFRRILARGKIPGYSGMDLHPPRQPGRQLKPVRGSLLVWPGRDHMLHRNDTRSEKILRKTRRKILRGRRTYKFKPVSRHRAVKTRSPSISGSRVQPRVQTQNRSEQTPINDLGGAFHMKPSSSMHWYRWRPVEKRPTRLFCAKNQQSRPETFQTANGPVLEFTK